MAKNWPEATLLTATVLWGASSALLSQLGGETGASAPFVAAGGAIYLWLAVWKAGDSESSQEWPGAWVLVTLGMLEALNISLYVAALQLSSPPIAVSLHLTTPVFLSVYKILRERVGFQARTMITIGLIVAAVAISIGNGPRAGYSNQGLGATAALGSALALAALVTLATKTSRQMSPSFGAATQLTTATGFLVPLAIVTGHFNARASLDAALVGIFFLGPGFALYWRAIQQLPPSRTSIIGLNEAIVATVISTIFFGHHLAAPSVAAAIMLMSAVIITVTGHSGETQRQ